MINKHCFKIFLRFFAFAVVIFSTLGNNKQILAQAQVEFTPSQLPHKRFQSISPISYGVRLSLDVDLPNLPEHYTLNTPANKVLDAWVQIGARVDGATPPGQPWPWYTTPFKGGVDTLANAADWLSDAQDTVGKRWSEGIEPGAGREFEGFFQGVANFSVIAQTTNGYPIFDPTHYQWEVNPGPAYGTYVAPGSTAEQIKIRTVATSTSTKEFRLDFGPVDPVTLQSFPRPTTTRVYVSKGNGQGESAGDGIFLPATVTINWHLRPVTFYRFRERFQLYNDGAPEDISQLIHDIGSAHANVVRTGAQLTETGMNTLYGQPASDLLYGPLISGGFHAAKTIKTAGSTFARTVATGIRDAKIAERGGNVVVKFETIVERAENIGTVTKAAAQADALTTVSQTSEAIYDTSRAVDKAEEAVQSAEQAIIKAKALKQNLIVEGKLDKAEQVEEKIQEMERLHTDAADALTFAKTKKAEASTSSGKFAEKMDALDNAGPNETLYTRLDDFADNAAEAASAARNSNRGNIVAGSNSSEVGRLGSEAATIGRDAGRIEDADNLQAASTSARNLGDTAATTGTNAFDKSKNLQDNNLKTLSETGYVTTDPQCFVVGTLISMGNGSFKAIEDVKAGDEVLTRDESSGETQVKKVVRTFENQAPSTLALSFLNGERIETTGTHPFYVEGQGFKAANALGIGTSIITRAGPSLQLVKSEVRSTPSAVYNLEVGDTHTYFVGKSALWVHNWCELPVGAQLKDETAWNYDPVDGKVIPEQIRSQNPDGSMGNIIVDIDKISQEGGTTYVISEKSTGFVEDPERWANHHILGIKPPGSTDVDKGLPGYLEALRSGSPDLPPFLLNPNGLLNGQTKLVLDFKRGKIDEDLEKAIRKAVEQFEAMNSPVTVFIKWPWTQ